ARETAHCIPPIPHRGYQVEVLAVIERNVGGSATWIYESSTAIRARVAMRIKDDCRRIFTGSNVHATGAAPSKTPPSALHRHACSSSATNVINPCKPPTTLTLLSREVALSAWPISVRSVPSAITNW